MKRIFLIYSLAFCFMQYDSYAQLASSFLKGEVYQNNAVNPAYFPEGKWLVGLPVLSNVSLNYNSRLSYSDVFTKLDDGTNLVDFNKILGSLKNQNAININTRIGDFHLGYRNNQAAISFFINERVEGDFFFPKSLVDFGVNGNAKFIGETLDLGQIGLNASYFREIGIGYTYFSKKGDFSAGYRLKFLQGFANYSLPGNLEASLTTGAEDFSLDFNVNNAVLRSTLVEENSSFIFSPNTGFSLDLGVDYRVNDKLSLAFSLLDLGFINWKSGVSNAQLNDVSFKYGGVDIRNTSNLADAVQDSLIDKFKIVSDLDDPYKTALPISGNATATWHLDNKSELIVSVLPRYTAGHMQMQYGAGISRKFGRNLKMSALVNKLPQQTINFGAGLSWFAGPLQIYMATNRLVSYDLTTLRSFDLTFGLNLVFGRGRIKKTKGHSPTKFRMLGGDEIKVKGKEKIYLIINKQKRKKPVNH